MESNIGLFHLKLYSETANNYSFQYQLRSVVTTEQQDIQLHEKENHFFK